MFSAVANGTLPGHKNMQPTKIRSQHFGVSLKFWFGTESIADEI